MEMSRADADELLKDFDLSQKLLQRADSPNPNNSLSKILMATIDTFQGGGADIFVSSLVRRYEEGSVGFS